MIQSQQAYAIGIDVGGTNTAAILMEFPSKQILHKLTTPTTKDIQTGIINSLETLIKNTDPNFLKQIKAIMLGTTAFMNAYLQQNDDLSPVSVIRLCQPATLILPPFVNWPENLKNKIKQKVYMIDGGYEINGIPISKPNVDQITQIAEDLIRFYRGNSLNILNVVISGVFSILNKDQEEQCAQIIKSQFDQECINYTLTLSNEMGQQGLLEREAASIMNASLYQMAEKQIGIFQQVVRNLNIANAQIFITQNDGTLMTLNDALKSPILTFQSGITNCLRGSQELSGYKNAIIIEIGNSATNLFQENGFFRTPQCAEIAGIRTNQRMPEIHKISFGCGSIVRFNESNDVVIGPESVGKKQSAYQGGSILTVTDIAYSSGYTFIEKTDQYQRNISHISDKQRYLALNKIFMVLEEAIDKIKNNDQETPVVLVGSGSFIIPNDIKLKGVSQIIKPQYSEYANVIGAVICPLSQQNEKIVQIQENERDKFIQELQEEISNKIVENGGKRDTVEIHNEIVPLQFAQDTYRVKVQATSQLDIQKLQTKQKIILQNELQITKVDEIFDEDSILIEQISNITLPDHHIIEINNGRKEWILTESDLDCISIGSEILGCGGGGFSYYSNLVCKEAIKAGHKIRVIDYKDMQEDEYAVISSVIAAPFIVNEKILSGNETVNALNAMINHLGQSKKVACTIPLSIGGMDLLVPLYTAALLDMPIVDCDSMGRSFPELSMSSFFIYEQAVGPCTSANESRVLQIVEEQKCKNANEVQQMLIKITIENGFNIGVAMSTFNKDQIEQFGIHNSISRCWRLGRAILESRNNHSNPQESLEKIENAKKVFEGKIMNVSRFQQSNKGEITMVDANDSKQRQFCVEFQSEYLMVYLKQEEQKEILAMVPDIICLLDNDSYKPIFIDELKHGMRVSVFCIPSHPLMISNNALKYCGPQAFGYQDIDYKSSINSKVQKSEINESSFY